MNMLKGIPEKVWRKIQYYRYSYLIKDLILRGLSIGKNVVIEPTVHIDYHYPYLITIGNNCAICNGVRLLAHDSTSFKFTGGYTRIGKIEIKDNCFIGENSIILPGVTIGPNVLVVAGSVVNKDIPPNSCVAGVPARFYAKFDEMIEEHKEQIKKRPIFKHIDLRYRINEQLKDKVKDSVKGGFAYVEGYRGKYPFILNKD
jgi:maltose O-acetyltransferase